MLRNDILGKQIVQHQVEGAFDFLCPSKCLFDKFLALLNIQFKEQKSPLYYSDALGATYYYLNLVCKKHSGKTANELIWQRLIEESQLLLRFTEMTANAIAYELGFSTPANFGTFYKKLTGQTPLEFRKGLLKNSAP